MLLPLDEQIKGGLNRRLADIGAHLKCDMMSIVGDIDSGLDHGVRNALELKDPKKSGIAIILETNGGFVEVVERIVQTIRTFYDEVTVIVPNRAMSAGTVFALSADRIMMDYFSRLGPIDPQISKDGKFVPAIAYLDQYEKLNEKAALGNLTTAEYAMLDKLDLGELYQFEQARDLSVELLIDWLSQYKFKNWKTTESNGNPVTEAMKRNRANEIAQVLNDPSRWHSHSRGIDIVTLQNELNLKIDDYANNPDLHTKISDYFNLLLDYLRRGNHFPFIHTEDLF